ncbi:hypothetical protein PV403_01295 [Paenibacillus sp. GYB006]|uniref:hypothetical protein n=1 Tax=Paenibacillus sp. GYB006 TaxID=2994394 RepID=UPI002F96374A
MRITKSFNNVWLAFINVVTELFRKNKWLFLVLIYVIYLGIEAFKSSKTSMIFVLCLIITLVSIGVYAKSKSYSETTLSFVLGLFTVFSTDWNKGYFIVFISFYVIFNIIVFSVSSIRLAAQNEEILIEAALKYPHLPFDNTKSKLNHIANQTTNTKLLSVLDRSECIRFLSYRRINIDYFEDSIEVIELIRVVNQTNLSNAMKLFYSLYSFEVLINSNNFSKERIIEMFDLIVNLPISPDDFFSVFNKLKRLIIDGQYEYHTLLYRIQNEILRGYDVDEIVEIIKGE